jgi:adenylate cyclase
VKSDESRAHERLAIDQLARVAPAAQADIERMVELAMLQPDSAGYFRPSDIQRVRAILAMRTPGIELEQLVGAFRAGVFTLEPMDILFPEPAATGETTFAQLAAELELEAADLRRLVIAAGFPAPQADDRLREDDAELIRLLVDAGRRLGGGEILQRTARVYGDAARRAAGGGLALYNEGVNSPASGRGTAPITDPVLRQQLNELGADLMRRSEELLAWLYRRHLEHGMLEQWAAVAETVLDDLGIRPLAERMPGVAFVDLSDYTRLTETSGDVTAARLAASLGELAEASAERHHGRVVKLLGDGAMLHFRDPLDAVRGALHLVAAIDRSELPAAHGGVHAGPVIERDGDYFGRTVNVAARISSAAGAGQVLVSAEVAARTAPGVRFEPAGDADLKGLGTLALFEAIAAPG